MIGDSLDGLPYLVVEELFEENCVSSVFSEENSKPLADTRIKSVKRVHAIKFAKRGCYLAKNLGKHPHYTVKSDEFDQSIRARCLDQTIPLTVYPAERTLTVSDILVVFNFGDDSDLDEEKGLQALLDDMNFQEFRENRSNLNDKSRPDKIRGPSQTHFGYGSNYSLERMPVEEGGYVRPRVLGRTVPSAWQDRFRVMTAIADDIYNHPSAHPIRGNATFPVYGKTSRNEKFANKLATDSRLEALTLSTSRLPGVQLKIHMDINNDDTPSGTKYNYNYVVCAWEHSQESDGSWVRDAVLGYSRRSVGDFEKRTNACSTYVTTVVRPWVNSLPVWRRSIVPGPKVWSESYFEGNCRVESDGTLVFPPTINKQATYLSAFADTFIRFRSAYEIEHKLKMSVEKQLECVLPVAFCNSSVPYVRIFQPLIDCAESIRRCGNRNVTKMFVELSNLPPHTSFRVGGPPRHQPTFNSDPSSTWIFAALRCLREAVLDSLKKSNHSYKCVVTTIKNINGVGDLTAQHLVHVMCLVGILNPKYGLEASICVGTKTAARLQAAYGITKGSFPCLLEYVAADMNYTKNIAENVTCKVMVPKNVRFKDCIMPKQEKLLWTQEFLGKPMVHYISRPQPRARTLETSIVNRITYNDKDLRFSNQMSFTHVDDIEDAVDNWHCNFPMGSIKTWFANEKVERKRKRVGDGSKSARKRRKHGVSDSPSRPPLPIDWARMDEKDLREHAMAYNKEIRAAAFSKIADATFGGSTSRGGSELRLVHSMGKHVTPKPRESSKSIAKSELKSPTHLQSLGIFMVSVDLYRIALHSFIREYRDTHQERTGKHTLTIRVHVGRRVGAKGRELFVATASLVTLSDRKTLETVFMGKNLQQQSIVGKTCVHVVGLLDNPNIPHNALVYDNPNSAKEDLLWYIASRNGNCRHWIGHHYPLQMWRTTCSQHPTGENGEATTDVFSSRPKDHYLLLTRRNGAAVTQRGNVFCTLLYRDASVVKAIFNQGAKSQVEITLANSFCVANRPGFVFPPTISEEDKQKNPPIANTTHSEKDRETTTTDELPKYTTLRIPSVIDPFGKESKEDTKQRLASWRLYWTDVVTVWRSSFVVRKSGNSGDMYWHPPGTSLRQRTIRSKGDLCSYLMFCVSGKVTDTAAMSPSNQTTLLTQWILERKKRATPGERNKKKRSKPTD